MSVVPYFNYSDDSSLIVYHDPDYGIVVVHNNQLNTILMLSDIVRQPRRRSYSNFAFGHDNREHPPNRFCPNCGYSWDEPEDVDHDAPPHKRRRLSSFTLMLLNDGPGFERSTGKQQFIRPDYFQLLGKLPHSPRPFDQILPKHFHHVSPILREIFNQDYFKRFFKKESPYLLGSGAHAQVFKVSHVLNGVKLGTYAVKRINVGTNFELLKEVLNEVLILYELSLKGANENNLIRYNHVWLELGDIDDLSSFILTPDEDLARNIPKQIPYVYILQQFCGGGHLEDLIIKNYQHGDTAQDRVQYERLKRRKRRSPSLDSHTSAKEESKVWLHPYEIFKFFKDIVTGVHYLHMNGIVHRDLKPSNCLLDVEYDMHRVGEGRHTPQDLAELPKALVTDFGEGLILDHRGVSEFLVDESPKESSERRGNTGTLEYTAPELWENKQRASDYNTDCVNTLNDFTYDSDIYPLGLILCYLCVGELPFSELIENDDDPQSVRHKISTWYADVTRELFGDYFNGKLADIYKGNNVGSHDYFKQFEGLIFAMVKGKPLPSGGAGRLSSVETLEALQKIELLAGIPWASPKSDNDPEDYFSQRRNSKVTFDESVVPIRTNSVWADWSSPPQQVSMQAISSALCLFNCIVLEAHSYPMLTFAQTSVKFSNIAGFLLCVGLKTMTFPVAVAAANTVATVVIIGWKL